MAVGITVGKMSLVITVVLTLLVGRVLCDIPGLAGDDVDQCSRTSYCGPGFRCCSPIYCCPKTRFCCWGIFGPPTCCLIPLKRDLPTAPPFFKR